ncbi:MAG: type II toxin-antitoxin system VapB family antitoxin [Deltaproteobacteria bacterium]|nr:type II toxin-antitoxin system VapB family antitoxin [Deltaproteobacteria bacterium]
MDEELINSVCEVLEVRSRSEAIRLALSEILRRKRLEKALHNRGKIDLDVDQDRLHELRNES